MAAKNNAINKPVPVSADLEEIVGKGPIKVRVPAWNRNAVKEIPH